jgi:hypothetical protein
MISAIREWIYQWFANNPQEAQVVEVVLDREFRLYSDGRFYRWSADLHETNPPHPATLTGTATTAYTKLQAALQTSRTGFQRPATK